MLLKRLELRGFKSFADNTTIEFDRGTTAVVGPNGSGKSNIADAIRWVLGEQSLRSIRSKRTEDIIFAGSSARSSVGMAEVSLTFDNSDERFPLPFNEVVITRRAYRSGENEYLINRQRSRWRDLLQLLQKAGININGYTVIGQGLVDMALSLKADERRELLEEAADVKRYRARIAEARDKLATTQQNILRANDVASELQPRLTQLADQARRLQQHQELSVELRSYQRQWFAHEWRRVAQSLAEAEDAEQQTKAHAQALQEQLRQQSRLLEVLASERQQLEANISELQSERAEVGNKMQESRRTLAVQKERETAAQRQMQELQGELTVLNSERQTEEENIADLRQRLEELRQQENSASAEMRVLEQKLTEAKKQRRHSAEACEAAQQRSFEIASRGAQLRNQIAGLRDRLEESREESQKNEEMVEQARVKVASLGQTIQSKQKELAALASQIDALNGQKEDLRQRLTALQTQKQALHDKQNELKGELGQLRTRHDLLAKLQRSRAGYYPGVKAVLDAASNDRSGQRLTGIVGVIASLVKTPARLEIAIEMALGGSAQNIVVTSWNDAEAAIAFLKRTSAGRATFLPLDSLRPAHRPGSPAASGNWPPKGDAGVLGMAAELVQYEATLASAVWYLLGRTMIVDDLTTARRVLKGCPSGWLIVTLAGELVRPGGAVTGGSRDRQGAGGLLTREREMRELPESIANAEAALAAVNNDLQTNRRQTSDLETQSAEIDGRAAQINKEKDQLANSLANLEREADRAEREITWWQGAKERQDKEMRALHAREEQIKAQLTETEQQQVDHAKQLEHLRTRLTSAESAEQEAAAATNELARSLAGRQGETRSTRELLQARSHNLQGLDRQLQAKQRRLSDLQQHLSGGEQERAALEANLAEQGQALQTLDELLKESDTAQRELARREETARHAQTNLSQELGEAEANLRENAVTATKCRQECERLRAHLESEGLAEELTEGQWSTRQFLLPITPQSPERQEDSAPQAVLANPEELKRRIDELKGQLRNVGQVNPQAINEYEEARERHGFLVEQALDLEKASLALQKVITELEKTARKKFEETFHAVAREFSKNFTTLFAGGSARLTLNRDSDASQPGIEIVAQPPGKRPQSLGLLSGGERALTAAALIFAVLEIVDTPFCVLDEVDAALDDTNVDRFGRTLARLAQRTQFIIITHNRGTMEIAETIYGVSMSETHTSKILSLHLPAATDDEAIQYAASPASH